MIDLTKYIGIKFIVQLFIIQLLHRNDLIRFLHKTAGKGFIRLPERISQLAESCCLTADTAKPGQCLKRCDYFFESLNKTLCLRFHILLYGRQKKSPAFDASLKTERIFQTINIIADSLIGFGQCLRLLCLHMILLDKFEQNNPVKRAAKIHMETLPFFHGICQRQFARYQFPQEFHLDQFFILLHFLVINFLQGQIFPLISDFLGNLRQMFQQNC